MRTGLAPRVRFLLALGAWTLAGQALLASAAVQRVLVVPFSHWQGVVAERYLLDAPLTVSVDPSCSGLEVLILTLAATLSYPVPWRKRLIGAAIGVVLLLSLNLVRIAVLGGASQSVWFGLLHLNIWPTILVVAAAGWIIFWIRSADRSSPTAPPATRRFAAWSAVMLGVYAAGVWTLTETQALDRAARGAAHLAAALLRALGADASVMSQVLRVDDMRYLVTPECITTPLIAFYFAAIAAAPIGWRARVWGTIASVPLFAGLAILRLLTVALPGALLGTTLFLTHAFNQILIGVAAIVAAALWCRDERSHARALAMGVLVAAVASVAAAIAGLGYAAAWSALLRALHLTVPPGLTPVAGDGNVQGALVILPIYQVAMFSAVWAIAHRHAVTARWVIAAMALVASQFVFLSLQGWMHTAGIRPLSALAVRGWAVAIPLLLILAAARGPRRVSPAPAEAVPS